jgi:hypothetical protein
MEYIDTQIATRYTAIISSSGTGTGGAANTGDITFNGVKIIGAGAASGDGNGYSTIELVPDPDLYVNDQYLIVDPTVGHIHIRAGGTQDDSNTLLILGGEKSNVTVSDNNLSHVIINSKTVDGTGQSAWEFEGGDTSSKGTIRYPGWYNSQSYNNPNGSVLVTDSATETIWVINTNRLLS